MQTNLLVPQRLFVQPIRYEIPPFQRRYVWQQEEQWEPLWQDIEELAQSIIEDGETIPHFMGAVVLQLQQFPTNMIQRRIVVDGQQRLTTLQLLIDAIQEVLEVRGHVDQSKRLSDLVLNGTQWQDGNPDHAYKVWPTVIDREAFRYAMDNSLSATDYSNSGIVQAHEFFKNQAELWLDRFATSDAESNQAATALERAVSQELEVVVIDLGESDDPNVIFETLNARGTPLLQSDMVKNKLMHDANINVLTEAGAVALPNGNPLWPFEGDDWWSQDVGRGLQRRPRVDVFLNHWLTVRNLTETKPYDEFRVFEAYSEKQTETGSAIEELASDMATIGKIYREVEEISRNDIKTFLIRRSIMNVGVVTPLLLWLLSSDLHPVCLSNCITAIESFLVRRVVCGLSARSYGELFVTLTGRLAEHSVYKADRVVVEYLAEQQAQAAYWPNDLDLSTRFEEAPLFRYLTRGRLRMLLEGIEKELHTEKAESEQIPTGLQIEHVMPQSWQQNWPLDVADEDYVEAAEDRERMLHTIGNLTLVNDRLNPALSNAAWDVKRKELIKHSTLFLNKELALEGPEIWDEQSIHRRSKWLQEIAVKVWPHREELLRRLPPV